MPIHITMDDAVKKGAEYLLSRQHISEVRKAEIMPATKYNLLVKIFNVSSVFLVATAVTALFLALTSSFVFLAIGLFLRVTSEKELNHYSVPLSKTDRDSKGIKAKILQYALQQTPEKEKITYIFQNVLMPTNEHWEPNEVLFLDFVAWKNTIDIPEVVEPKRSE